MGGIPTSYPDCIADDAHRLSRGDDIFIIQVVILFLPISDDNEDLGGIISGPTWGTEQSVSVRKKEGPEATASS